MSATARAAIRPLRDGQLIPRRRRGLRAAVVALAPGASMTWHSTKRREELLIVLRGKVVLEWFPSGRRGAEASIRLLREGQCAFLRSRTRHRLLNGSPAVARYVYVTGPA